MKNIFKYFPEKIKNTLIENAKDDLEEIRIRVKKPIYLKFSNSENELKYIVSKNEIIDILEAICENSIYSYQNQIAEGFITLEGGHRVGISGSCVIENGKVININYINSLNFRIAREVIGCSKDIFSEITNKNTIYNTLIISPPGAGKTTILRDLSRKISDNLKLNVGLVDERGEIAALFKGVPQNDIGIKTDVIENVSKSIGMKMLIRSMAPKVIIADEIGNSSDIESINYAVCSGCKGIFTAHGSSIQDLKLNPILNKLLNLCVFEILIFLDENQKGKIKEIYYLDKDNLKYEEEKCI